MIIIIIGINILYYIIYLKIKINLFFHLFLLGLVISAVIFERE